jgi:AcrR family transcriptional regulator
VKEFDAVTPAGRRTDTDAVLDAVRDCVLAVGVRRTTLSDVARRAGVSRMTLYRTWPDVRSLVGDLMTREWQAVTDAAAARLGPPDAAGSTPTDAVGGGPPDAAGSPPDSANGPSARARVVATLVSVTRTIRDHPLFRKIVEVDPELLLPYLLDRRGASQEYFLESGAKLVAAGQREGSIRPGDPVLFARAMLLVGQSYAMSGRTMADAAAGGDGPDLATLDAELACMLDRYLAP